MGESPSRGQKDAGSRRGGGPDTNRVLVVAPSPIDRIVIARTIQRIYLKPVSAAPEEALHVLIADPPVLVVVDRAIKDELLNPLMDELSRRRRISEGSLPRILMIETARERAHTPPFAGVVDMTISKPILQETLQRAVERLIGG